MLCANVHICDMNGTTLPLGSAPIYWPLAVTVYWLHGPVAQPVTGQWPPGRMRSTFGPQMSPIWSRPPQSPECVWNAAQNCAQVRAPKLVIWCPIRPNTRDSRKTDLGACRTNLAQIRHHLGEKNRYHFVSRHALPHVAQWSDCAGGKLMHPLFEPRFAQIVPFTPLIGPTGPT